MSLVNYLTDWIDKDRESLTYAKIDPSHVQPAIQPESLQSGVHYIRIRLANMFLKKETEWFSQWYPAVHSVVQFKSGDQTIEVPNIADEGRLGIPRTAGADVIARNFMLTPTVPFNGGTVTFTAGLFALQAQNNLAQTLKVLGNFAGLLDVSQLSLALNIVKPLALGIQEALGPQSGNMHLGFHDTFSQGELQSGYLAAIRAPANSVDSNELFVINNELYQREGLAQAKPYNSHDHMLFRVELFDKRDDWESLTSIQEPFQQALAALPDETKATHFMQTALLKATLSPDLTKADKRRVVDQLIANYEQSKKALSFRGAVGQEVPTLKQVMKQAGSAKAALSRGEPTVREVFRVIEESRSDRKEPAMPVPTGISDGQTGVRHRSARHTRGTTPTDDRIFYFATKGDGVRMDEVRVGAEFDLIFNYGVPYEPILVETEGEGLNALANATKAELDISLIPRGFTLKDSKWIQRATFVNGSIDKPMIFHLQAANEVVANAGIGVIMETNGAVLYEFFIPLRLREDLDAKASAIPVDAPRLNLDELAQAQSREQRAARLHIFADGDKLSINFDNLATGESFSVQPKLLTRTSLSGLLGRIKAEMTGVPDHSVWQKLEDSLAKPAEGSSTEKGFKFCLEGVAAAGALLYKELARDEDVAPILKAIDELPYGSTLSVRTDCAFLPWEILNPSDFILKFKENSAVQPQNFWGYRLSIECLLAGQRQNYKTPTSLHQTSPAYVSMNIFRTIDDHFAQMTSRPGQSHETLSPALPPFKTEIRKKGDDILRVFATPNYEATFIYLFCHGQNDKALDPGQQEMLEVDKDNFLKPTDLPTQIKYPRGPIVFLNSCSSGSYLPLAFSTFLSVLREKQALGLVATSFPVPITFGSAFGRELMRRYFKSKDSLGKALFELRREQLANGNPLGLFYSLQCPADITARVN